MADHAKPILTSTYTNFVTELDARFDDLAVGLDPAVTTASNLPTNSIRWNSASNLWQKWNGTSWDNLSSSFSININGTVGATTASTGAFTTLSASGAITASSGTSNGIAYLNSSKVLTMGSNLTYDGANMGIGTNSPSSVPGFTTLKINSAATGALLDLAQGNVMRGRFAASATEFAIETSGVIPIYFAPGGSTAVMVNSDGNAGFGTTLPLSRLHVAGSGTGSRVTIDSTSSTGTQLPVLNLYRSNTSSMTTQFVGQIAFTRLLTTGALNSAATITVTGSNVAGSSSGTLTSDATTAQRWTISGVEAYRVDSNRALLIGGISSLPSGSVYGVGFEGVGSLGAANFSRDSGRTIMCNRSGTDGSLVEFQKSGNQVGSISVTGSTTSYITSSDYRLKTIMGPLKTSGTYIDSLKPVEGRWKSDGSAFVGLIAHEVQEISITKVATGTKDGENMQGMDYSNPELIANLIAELQSVRKRLAALEALQVNNP